MKQAQRRRVSRREEPGLAGPPSAGLGWLAAPRASVGGPRVACCLEAPWEVSLESCAVPPALPVSPPLPGPTQARCPQSPPPGVQAWRLSPRCPQHCTCLHSPQRVSSHCTGYLIMLKRTHVPFASRGCRSRVLHAGWLRTTGIHLPVLGPEFLGQVSRAVPPPGALGKGLFCLSSSWGL